MDPTLLQILQAFTNTSIQLQQLREASGELEAKNEQLKARIAELVDCVCECRSTEPVKAER